MRSGFLSVSRRGIVFAIECTAALARPVMEPAINLAATVPRCEDFHQRSVSRPACGLFHDSIATAAFQWRCDQGIYPSNLVRLEESYGSFKQIRRHDRGCPWVPFHDVAQEVGVVRFLSLLMPGYFPPRIGANYRSAAEQRFRFRYKNRDRALSHKEPRFRHFVRILLAVIGMSDLSSPESSCFKGYHVSREKKESK
jgi:hypothetical protein